MAIKQIQVQNVMAFQNNAFSLSFSDGVNVLIGENGTGKTTLLKLIYAAMECAPMEVGSGINVKFYSFFSDHLKGTGFLKHPAHQNLPCSFQISDGNGTIRFDFPEALKRHQSFRPERRFESVFIPAAEMLSHSKGFLALNRKFHMPFDATQIDIIMNASLPEARETSLAAQSILDKISRVIDGTVICEDDIFYILKSDGRKLDFALEAEGLRKLGLLWKLVRNGLLEKNSILLWDEPEANLNPELFPLVAEILLELARNGVQIFAATHSYNFAKYLEIRDQEEKVAFHTLYKEPSGGIGSISGYEMEDSEKNPLIDADNKLLDAVYDVGVRHGGNL